MLNETQTVDSTSIYSYVHSKQSDSELFSSLSRALSVRIQTFWLVPCVLNYRSYTRIIECTNARHMELNGIYNND